MSGERPPKPGPATFTQDEIDALAAGRRPAAITRRLTALETPAARPVRRGGSSKPEPPGLTRAELTALRDGRPSPAVKTRLFSGEELEAAVTILAPGDKPYPSEQPPARRRTRS
jgi:hypothetical protein